MAGIFKRVEKKYLLTAKKSEDFIERLGDRIVPDKYTDYTICNVYYDTEYNDLIRRSLDKPRYKEKFRVRCYGTAKDDTKVYLELKKKWKGVVYKRRVGMPMNVAAAYLEDGVYPGEYDCQILREIDYAIKFYDLKPNVFLAYDRMAYVVKDMPEIRFTIDQHIRSRKTDMDLRKDTACDELYEEDMRLLEIKAPDSLPLWFVAIMDELEIRSSSFSKYGRVYQSRLKSDLESGQDSDLIRQRYTVQQLELAFSEPADAADVMA